MKALFVYIACIIALLLYSTGKAHAHNGGATAYAIPLKDITIDGRLDDWPEDMIRYPILNHGQAYGPTDIDLADLTTSTDLRPYFMVGFNPEKNLIYLAVYVRDDSVIVAMPDLEDSWSTDACEVYIDGSHSARKIDIYPDLASDMPALQYLMWPPGGGYGSNWSYSTKPAYPDINRGDIARTKTKCKFKRKGDITIYEWEIQAFDAYPDTPTELEFGKTISFEVVVVDKDTEMDKPAWVCWAPYYPGKYLNSYYLGDLILVENYDALGTISGTVTRRHDKFPFAGIEIIVKDQEGLPRGNVTTHTDGRYIVRLLPGTYHISVVNAKRTDPVQLTLKASDDIRNINFEPTSCWDDETAWFIENLKNGNMRLEKDIPFLFQGLGINVKTIVPAVIEFLKDRDPFIRRTAVRALVSFNLEPKVLVQELIKVLEKDKDPGVLIEIIEILRNMESEAREDPLISKIFRDDTVSTLVKILKSEKHKINPSVRIAAARCLGEMGSEARDAIPELREMLKDDNSYYIWANVVKALGSIGSDDKEVVKDIIEILNNNSGTIKRLACGALGNIGPDAEEAVPEITEMLMSNNPWDREPATEALGKIKTDNEAAINWLNNLLEDNYLSIRIKAANSLGEIGYEARNAIPGLINALTDKDESEQVRESAKKAIVTIAQTLSSHMNEMNSSDIKKLIDQLKSAPVDLTGPIKSLKAEYKTRFFHKPLEWVKEHKLYQNPWLMGIAAYIFIIIACLLTWFLFLWTRPLLLYKLNKKLRHPEIIPEWLGISIGLRQILLLSFFNYNHRVLDAWVKDTFEKAHSQFENLQTIQERKIYVPMPVTIDGRTVDQPATEDFNGIFTKERFCLLIWGEGGSGKTSLACRLARWAMNEDVGKPLSGHLMLPVLIEHDLHETLREQKHPFLQAIHSQVELITGDDDIEPEFMRHLLKKRRILVIVDRLSEMNVETRKLVQLGYDPELKINALISTSRIKESMHGALINTVEPLRIDKEHLLPFMVSYLKHENLEDSDYFDACSHLSKISGARGITALMAKLYAEQLITIKKEITSLEDLPDTIPDLMLGYLNWINRNKTEKDPDHRTIHRISKVVAWASMKDTFKPSDASISVVQNELPDEKDIDEKLAYMSEKLGLIRFVGHSLNRIRITLDPLAEYLAGLYLLELYRSDEAKWRQFLDEIDKKDVDIEAIEDFLLAVLDCCQSEGKEYKVPGFVEAELSGRLFPVQMAV